MKKNKLKRNFIIGSANFSKTYGADAIKVDKIELKKIFSLAKKKIFMKLKLLNHIWVNQVFSKVLIKNLKF